LPNEHLWLEAIGQGDFLSDWVLQVAEEYEAPLRSHCFWSPLAAFVLSWSVGDHLIFNQGHACGDMDSGLLREHARLMKKARRFKGPNVIEGFLNKHRKTTNEWELFVLVSKYWTMTTDLSLGFAEEARAMADYGPPASPQGAPAVVCVRGATHVAEESLVFVHFVWGHLFPTFVALAQAGVLHRRTRLVFTERPFFCPRSSWLRFYGLFLDELPRFDETCAGATSSVSLDPEVPVMTQYEDKSKMGGHYDRGVWERHLEHCAWRPSFHQVLRSRLALPVHRGRTVVYMTRGLIGAVGRTGETLAKRNLLNHASLAGALQRLGERADAMAQAQGWVAEGTVRVAVSSTDLPWREQVRLFAGADVLLGLHGSALAAHEVWLPPGSIVVSVMSPGICECRWAYCAAASAERALLYVLATTPDANCQLGGRWLEHGGYFEPPQLHSPYLIEELVNKTHVGDLSAYTRHFEYSGVLAGLEASLFPVFVENVGWDFGVMSARFGRWAAQNGHARACGGAAVQVSDSGEGALGIS